jgi:hypothetical protein
MYLQPPNYEKYSSTASAPVFLLLPCYECCRAVRSKVFSSCIRRWCCPCYESWPRCETCISARASAIADSRLLRIGTLRKRPAKK